MRKQILKAAKIHGYALEQEQPEIGLMIFTKGGVQINVYTTRMTVGTCLEHPKKGKTQMFRKNVSLELLDRIFKNPRVHTQAGYRRK